MKRADDMLTRKAFACAAMLGIFAQLMFGTAAAAQYDVTIDGAKAVQVRDASGRTGTNVYPTLPGATFYREGETATMIVLPVAPYHLSFMSHGETFMIEILRHESGAAPEEAVRYIDLNVPKGTRLTLELGERAIGPLTALAPGRRKRVITPTAAVSGTLARDVEGPRILFKESATRLEITAIDDAGVASLRYSLDGTHYWRYTRPLVLNSSSRKTVYAMADDKVGNRRLEQYRLKGER